ncbi:hypothetical protein THRCLA_20837 [Thraustotheca clavata]|uniref:PX domain-containing protein n=1 Tax=Thraustotheca clavata TaxID=74557 RepID=A0A1W0A347_9STRA|nr:hypothetical protein THRCLA_20837 [Thraustotheca clavata]
MAQATSSSIRVKIIGHEKKEDKLTNSDIIVYRTVVLYNEQRFEQAIRFSRFYNFHMNLKTSEQKAITAKFPPRHPFKTVLTEKMLQKRENMLNAYIAAVCALPLNTHMESALLKLFEIRKHQLNPSLPPVSETSSVKEPYSPVSRIFSSRFDESASYCSSVRSSAQLMSSSSSDLGRVAEEERDTNEATQAKEMDEDEDDSLFEEALMEPVQIDYPSLIKQAALAQLNKVNSLLHNPIDVSMGIESIPASNYQDAIEQQLCVINSMLKEPSQRQFEGSQTRTTFLQPNL